MSPEYMRTWRQKNAAHVAAYKRRYRLLHQRQEFACRLKSLRKHPDRSLFFAFSPLCEHPEFESHIMVTRRTPLDDLIAKEELASV